MTEQVYASSDRAQAASILETTYGVTPDTPAMRKRRATAYAYTPDKRMVTSRELRADAMISASAVVGKSTSGNTDIQLSLGGDHDDVIEAVLRGTYQVNLDAATVAVIAGNKFQKTGAFNNVTVGQRIRATGFTQPGNNGWHRVTAKTNDDITVASTLTVEAATANTRVRSKTLRNGVVRRSFSLELAYLDIGVYLLYRGARWGTLNLAIEAEREITGSASFMGMDVLDNTVQYAGSYINPTTAQMVTASENLGNLLIDGVPVSTGMRTFNFTVNDNLRNQTQTGTQFPANIAYGNMAISGRAEFYFKDRTLYQAAMNHQSLALDVPIIDAAGNGLHLHFPHVKLGAPQQNVSGQNTDIMQTFDFTAHPDVATDTYQIQVDVAHA